MNIEQYRFEISNNVYDIKFHFNHAFRNESYIFSSLSKLDTPRSVNYSGQINDDA